MRLLTAIFATVLLLGAAPGVFAGHQSSSGTGDAGFAPLGANAGAGRPFFARAVLRQQVQLPGPRPAGSTALHWSFRSSSVPSGLSTSAVLNVIKRAFGNVTGEHNDCGRGDTVSATSSYLGTTTRKPDVGCNGACGPPDGHNVVAFAPLDGFYAGYTCIWWSGTTIVEADMRLDTHTNWALSGAGCSNELMMEALVTHEAGHAFGLAHVGEGNHGRLTMSVYIDGLCENQEATLGLGDMKGLESLY